MHDIRFDQEVVVEELGGARVVREDAADGRGGDEDRLRAMARHPRLDVGLAAQVELRVRHGEQFATLAREPAHQRRADHAAMPGDPDALSS